MSLTSFIRNTGATLLKELDVFRWELRQSRRLKKFHNIHEGEDCFIIGNGPSLNKMDLSLLNDYYTFGMNKIFLIFERMDLKLDYHVAVNKHVIHQSINEFADLGIPSFMDFQYGSRYTGKNDNFHFVLCNGKWNFYEDLTQPIGQGGTVTFTAMHLAYFMGFRRVFIVGCDHSFQQQGNPNETQKMEGDDVNHFDPNYFKGMKWQLADLGKSEVSYFMAKKGFEADGRKIIDATIDGKLDIYDKISFEEALRLAKKKK